MENPIGGTPIVGNTQLWTPQVDSLWPCLCLRSGCGFHHGFRDGSIHGHTRWNRFGNDDGLGGCLATTSHGGSRLKGNNRNVFQNDKQTLCLISMVKYLGNKLWKYHFEETIIYINIDICVFVRLLSVYQYVCSLLCWRFNAHAKMVDKTGKRLVPKHQDIYIYIYHRSCV